MAEASEEKQKILIELLLSSKELFIKCGCILKPEYFESPFDSVIEFAMGYVQKYNDLPDMAIVTAQTDVKLEHREINDANFEWVTDEIESHCQHSAMFNAIIDGANIIGDEEEPDYGKVNVLVREALMVSIDKDMGINYFDDPATRLAKMQEHIDSRTIGWESMDRITDKCRRGELVLFAGSSGSGKSVVLANIAHNMLMQGLNGIVFSLELGEDLITKRMDSITTGIAIKDIFNSIDDVVSILETTSKSYGECFVKKLPVGSNVTHIRAYLTEYKLQFSREPDFIIVDYLDQMGASVRVDGGIFEIDKLKTEELREVFVDYNAYGFTASQLNRDSVGTEHKSQAHIAGGLSKINTSDITWAIVRNEEQIDNNEIHFTALKLRNSEFSTKPVILHWDSKTLRLSELQGHRIISQSNAISTSGTSKTRDRLDNMLRNKNKKKK